MSKKNKKISQTFELPSTVDMDALSYSSDEELRQRNFDLSMSRDQVIRSGSDPFYWEIELAYVHREIQIREMRKVLHERYIRTNPELFALESADYN